MGLDSAVGDARPPLGRPKARLAKEECRTLIMPLPKDGLPGPGLCYRAVLSYVTDEHFIWYYSPLEHFIGRTLGCCVYSKRRNGILNRVSRRFPNK